MSTQANILNNKIKRAITDMQRLISRVYPDTTYTVSYQDDPEGVQMIATVDTEDLDGVIDCFIDRLLKIQVDEGLPLYIIPVRPARQIVEKPRSLNLPLM